MLTPPIFAFWTEGLGPHGKKFPSDCYHEWQRVQPNFTVFGDNAVLEALRPWGNRIQELYLDIRIPACRSDIARLALLRMIGGTYVDAHTAPGDTESLFEHLGFAKSYDLVVFEIDPHLSPLNFSRIFNSPMSAAPNTAVLDDMICCAFSNLMFYRETRGFSGECAQDYSIFAMTGPTMVRDVLVDFSGEQWTIKDKYQSRVSVISLDKSERSPFRLYRYSQYRSEENHWTKRERREPLFSSFS